MELHLQLILKDDATPREIAQALLTAAVDASGMMRTGDGPDEAGDRISLRDAMEDDDVIVYANLTRIV